MPVEFKPAPPMNPHSALVCKAFFFGAETHDTSSVSCVVKAENTTTSVG